MTTFRRLSLVDVVTIGAVFCMAAGTLMSSVLIAREAARQRTCEANLSRIAKGIHAYGDAHQGAVPPGVIAGGTSWITNLLPYVGEEAVHARYKLELPFTHPDNAAAVTTRLPLFECPEIRRDDRLVPVGEDNKLKAAPTDYVGLTITGAVRHLFPPGFDTSGVLIGLGDRSVRLHAIPDGTSYTGLVYESADKNNRWQAGKQVAGNSGQAGAWAGGALNGYRGYSFDGVQVPGPCAVNCNNSTGVYGFHSGGANIVMVDNSVRFMSDKMDVMVMYAIVTRNGGEMLTDFDF